MEVENYSFTRSHTQIAKGVAVTLMMIHHLFRFPDRIMNVSYTTIIPNTNPTIEFIIGDFGGICIAMFVFLSGYGMYMSSLNEKNLDLKKNLERVSKFLFSYWVVFIVFVPIGLIFFKDNIRYNWNFILFIQNFFMINNSYNGEWWFARLYIEIMLLYPVLKTFLNKNVKISLLATILIRLIGTLVVEILNTIPLLNNSLVLNEIDRLLFYQLTFCMGYLIAKYEIFKHVNVLLHSINLDKFWSNLIICILSIIIRLQVSSIFGEARAAWFDFIISPIFILAVTNILFNIKHNKIVLLLGKHSTNIWLTHTFFCYYYFQNITQLSQLE